MCLSLPSAFTKFWHISFSYQPDSALSRGESPRSLERCAALCSQNVEVANFGPILDPHILDLRPKTRGIPATIVCRILLFMCLFVLIRTSLFCTGRKVSLSPPRFWTFLELQSMEKDAETQMTPVVLDQRQKIRALRQTIRPLCETLTTF